MEFLVINFTKDSSLLLRTIHRPFYWRILQKAMLFSGFKNTHKKSAKQENSMPFENSISGQNLPVLCYPEFLYPFPQVFCMGQPVVPTYILYIMYCALRVLYEIFSFKFSWISFPRASEYPFRTISIRDGTGEKRENLRYKFFHIW